MSERDDSGIGDRIRSARGKLSQADFAKEIGVGLTTLRRYESGERVPDASTLRAIAQNGHDIRWLVLGDRPEVSHESPKRDLDLRVAEEEMVLDVVAQDADAAKRRREKMKVVGQRMRESQQLVEDLLSQYESQPGPLLRSALEQVAFTEEVPKQVVGFLISAVADELSKRDQAYRDLKSNLSQMSQQQGGSAGQQ